MRGRSWLSPSKWICATTCSVALTTAGVASAQAPATAPPFTPAPINGTLVDFITGLPVSHTMQVMAKPKLMRPGFAGEPVDTAKGLASKIKAKEVDVPKRVKAAKYLGKVDCQAFPDSQKQLLDLVVNDEFEEVRLAAAKAFKEQFSKGCNPNPSKKKQRRYDTCRGCCNNTEILNKLAERAYECDDTGCAKEPSPRVREAIAEALNCCCCWQYHTGGSPEQQFELSPPPDAAPAVEAPKDAPAKEAPPSAPPEASAAALAKPSSELASKIVAQAKKLEVEEVEEADVSKAIEKEVGAEEELEESKVSEEKESATTAEHVTELTKAADAQVRRVTMVKSLPEKVVAEPEGETSRVECLRGHCPVAMVERRLEKASAEFTTNYKGCLYEFSSAEALEKFQSDPERYAPVFNGHCIMTFAKTNEKVAGKFCTEYDGRQYWFASKELRDEFKADADRIIDDLDDQLGDD